MAMKGVHVCLVVFVVIAVQMVYSRGPVASERRNELESNATSNISASSEDLLKPVDANDVSGSTAALGNGLKKAIFLPKHQKEQLGHRRNHKPKKHHGKRHHHHHHKHHHQHHHHSAENPLPNASPAFSFDTQTVETSDFFEEYAQITPALSVNNQLISTPVYRYAGAEKAEDDSQIKIAKIGGLNPSPSPTITPERQLATTSRLRANQSIAELPTNTPDEPDPCSIWQNCALHQDVIARRWLQALPSCPCQFGFPSIQHFYNNNTIYDQALNKDFQWRLMNSYVDKRSIPRPTADLCIESLSDSASNSSQSQVCCYNSRPLKLITRGIGAGTPLLESLMGSYTLHHKIDIEPILFCNGDWTRYHAVRPPNNGRNCPENPDDDTYALQVLKARDY